MTADEPIDPSDWQITDDLTVNLRAERSGNTGDRVYTVWVECLDHAGSRSVGSTTVTVAHDNAATPAPRRRLRRRRGDGPRATGSAST
ncbi:MAG TPA: hypothetical protein VI670_06800, partial [Thermoanaerobaculia bacterium]